MLYRPVLVYSPDGFPISVVEGNLRQALKAQVEKTSPTRTADRPEGTLVSGRNHEKREVFASIYKSKLHHDSSGEKDRSWKHWRKVPKDRTLCRRQRRKPQYN
jgi:hypothetical protein